MITKSNDNSGMKELKGVSTLEFFKALRLTATFLFFILLVFGNNSVAQQTSFAALRGHSTLDLVDPTFNAQISTTSYNQKSVYTILPLPDGKILVGGRFNSYNRVATGSLVRLNADGILDSSFINDTIAGGEGASSNGVNVLAVQPDGKILAGGVFTLSGETATRPLVRLNADGTLDTTFSFTVPTFQFGVRRILVRPNGKIVISCEGFTTPGGVEGIIQLNSDGSLDNSFNAAVSAPTRYIEFQNGKLLTVSGNTAELARLNDDGSFDTTFNRRTVELFQIFVQPDGKIIGQRQGAPRLSRFNVDGTDDPTFQQTQQLVYRTALAPNGGIVILSGTNPYTLSRLLPNGAPDPSFSMYTQSNIQIYSVAVQGDGKILIGDQTSGTVTSPINFFKRFNPDGTPDTAFNTGTGFQLLTPGKVEAFAVQPNNKLIIGGRFDLINDVSRFRMARLNEDGTLDDSFQISTTAANRFISITEIHNLALQSDGKILVSGAFTYTINGVMKNDFVRLNPDGSIDASYNLALILPNFAGGAGAGKNKIIMRPGNKALVGTSRITRNQPYFNPPVIVNSDATRDNGFNSAYRSDADSLFVYDLFVQPDGKIIIGGRYTIAGANITRGFVARLNSDGSLDSTFQISEENGKAVKALAVLPDGKILAARVQAYIETSGEVVRFNSNGTPDTTFNTSAVNGKINALLAFDNGKILAGGFFTKFNNQARRNLAVLNEDGSLDSMLLDVNQEVLSLAFDNQERILVGGAFTTISTGTGSVNRSYLARLLSDAISSSTKPRFDFDGDGRSDLALFNQTTGIWTIRSSRANQTVTTHFGKNGDLTAPADYDNDGTTDIAVYRPSEGIWYLQQSTAGFKAVRWGAAEDKPVAADYDGDGRADIAVFRPSNRIWYILQSSNNQLRAVHFGLETDVLLREVDFDGDGKSDIAVYRPSNGGWYWLASNSNNAFKALLWGAGGDVPAPADYNGDGKTDIAVYRLSNGVWYQQLSTESGNYSFAAQQFGINGDVPVVADYNGDGKADISIRRGEIWALLLSAQGYTGMNFGNASDAPVAAVQP
ncbi:MAG: FG-GAP-like repeat-containing protein [Acidobacteriota bacterium]|nr:FG-GAP-like repeat-containing protein [Acidobacteriota bacterium]